MAKLPEFLPGSDYYVSNPEGLENIPQGTVLVATQEEIQIAVPMEAGGGVLNISPDKFRSNCEFDWRRNETVGSIKHLGVERVHELLDGNRDDCKLRKTDTVEDVLILMRKAVEERAMAASMFIPPSDSDYGEETRLS